MEKVNNVIEIIKIVCIKSIQNIWIFWYYNYVFIKKENSYMNDMIYKIIKYKFATYGGKFQNILKFFKEVWIWKKIIC